MANPIVTVQVNIQVAPAPLLLQKTGALISQGGTITSPGTKTLLTQESDLTPFLTPAKALSSLSWAGGTVSAATAVAHGFTIGEVIPLTIAGAVPSGYNGTYNCAITGTSSFTYSLQTSPGAETSPGTYAPLSAGELQEMANTFFAQGSAQSVYVLELGAGGASDGVAFLNSWIAATPQIFYSYLVPRSWDGNAAFLSFLAGFEATNSKTYFWVTTTLAGYTAYAGMKGVVWLVEAPEYGVWPANALQSISWASGSVTALTTTAHGVTVGQWFQLAGVVPSGYNGWHLAADGTAGSTLVFALATNPGSETTLGTLVQSQFASAGIDADEFSLAAPFRVTLNYAPTSTNKVTPLNFAFLFGVTQFPTAGNAALINTLLAAGGNIVGDGSQGGISDTLMMGGKTGDANPFKYWYSIDRTQVNLQRNLTAALINGANNPVNPVDYNQPGINTLQQAAVTTMATGVADGLVLNPIKATTLSADGLQQAQDAGTLDGYTAVNADPFGSYVAENPTDYAAGIYNGIAVDYTPLRGFESVTINVTVSNFAG